jgi:ribosome modulation factor
MSDLKAKTNQKVNAAPEAPRTAGIEEWPISTKPHRAYISRAEKEGRKAFLDGAPYNANPYPTAIQCSQWERGWKEAKTNQKVNAAPKAPRELPAYEVFYEDGSSYVTSMAHGTTLEDARKYFVGKWLTQPDESSMQVVDVHEARSEPTAPAAKPVHTAEAERDAAIIAWTTESKQLNKELERVIAQRNELLAAFKEVQDALVEGKDNRAFKIIEVAIASAGRGQQ